MNSITLLLQVSTLKKGPRVSVCHVNTPQVNDKSIQDSNWYITYISKNRILAENSFTDYNILILVKDIVRILKSKVSIGNRNLTPRPAFKYMLVINNYEHISDTDKRVIG